MHRREFITLLGGATAAWPLVTRAQQPVVPTIGFLHPATPESQKSFLTAMRQQLAQSGYVEGKNLVIEYRWGENQSDRLPALAADLVRRQVAVMVTGATPAAIAAKAATQSIPIVFVLGSDPVALGLVASLNRPGGNLTGITNLANTLVAKRLSLLDELVARSGPFGMLVNPDNPNAESDTGEAQSAAAAVGRRLIVVRANTDADVNTAFAALAEQQIAGLYVDVDPFFSRRRDQLAALAARYRIPASYATRDYTAAGGLMSYEANSSEAPRQVGIYVARILRGEKPTDLPVVQPAQFELVINLKAAKALGLAVPAILQAIADEVIE